MIHSKILGSVSKNVGSKTDLFYFQNYLVKVSLGEQGWEFFLSGRSKRVWQFWDDAGCMLNHFLYSIISLQLHRF